MMSSSASTTKHTEFDALGRVLKSEHWVDGTNYTFTYGYNHVAMTSQGYPSGRVVNYGYDGAGRVETVNGQKGTAATPYVTTVSYRPHGAMELLTLGNGRFEKWCYSPRLAVTDIVLRTAAPVSECNDASGNLATIKLTYGASGTDNGNVMSQQVGDGASWNVTQNYLYDKLNRLGSATEGVQSGGWKYQFGYDAWGNGWVEESQSWGLLANGNRPKAGSWFTAKNRLNLTPTSFDKGGNQKEISPWTLSYDAENRVKQAVKTGWTDSYDYDGEGRRVKKVSGSLTTVYVYTASGELAAEYETGTGGTPMPCTTCYLFGDHLGSTRAVWDAAGVQRRYDYAPFGERIEADRNGRSMASCAAGVTNCFGSVAMKVGFTGKERDGETGLDFFEARYMSAAQGRFMGLDSHPGLPENPQSLNKYTYVLNNPMKLVDPDGLFPTPVHVQWTTDGLKGFGFSNAQSFAQIVTNTVDVRFFTTNYLHGLSGESAYRGARVGLLSTAASGVNAAESAVALVLGMHLVQDYQAHRGLNGLRDHFRRFGFGDADPNSKAGAVAQQETQKFLNDFQKLLVANLGEAGAQQFLQRMQASAIGLMNNRADNSLGGKRSIDQHIESIHRRINGLQGYMKSDIKADAERQCALGNSAACGI